jgi:Methyltransferase FkbM domain
MMKSGNARLPDEHASRQAQLQRCCRQTSWSSNATTPVTGMQVGLQIYGTLPARTLRFVKGWLPALVQPTLALHCAWLAAGKQQFSVPGRTLQSLFAALHLERVDLLKIDTEGMELEVRYNLCIQRLLP